MIVPDSVAVILDECDRMGGKPTLKESRALVERYLKGDKRAWDEFSIRNSKMVAHCVMKWCKGHVIATPFEDLFQAGMTGLLHSMKRIQLDKIPGNPTTYCFLFVAAEIRRSSARDLTSGMAKESTLRAAWASGDAELSRDLAEAMRAAPLLDRDGYGSTSDEDEQYPTHVFDLMDRIDSALQQMPAESVRVIAMRYGMWGGVPQSYVQIGKVLGCGSQAAKDRVEASVGALRAIIE